jgi:hypothetical protein
MKNKNRKAARKGILVECELVEITDPAEQAELDRRFAAAIRMVEGEEPARPKKSKPRKKK